MSPTEVFALVLGVFLIWSLQTMQTEINRLRASVLAQTSVIAGAVALLGGMASAIRETAGDEAAVNALADQVDAQTGDLAKAVAAQTPASAEVHVDDSTVKGGTGDDATAVDPGTVTIEPAAEPETGGETKTGGEGEVQTGD